MLRSSLRHLFAAAVALVLGACAAPDAIGPRPLAEEPAFAVATTTQPTVFSSEKDPRLLAWLEKEKARVAVLQQASEPIRIALKIAYEQWKQTNPNGDPRFLVCEPISYAAQVKLVGPLGAELGFGAHKLKIPQGALSGWTVVTAEAPVSKFVEARFSPHGLKFLKQPELELSYKHCNLQGDVAQRVKRITYVDNFYKILENVRSSEVIEAGLVRGWISHFSGYIIAW